jgi:hypothetical protein
MISLPPSSTSQQPFERSSMPYRRLDDINTHCIFEQSPYLPEALFAPLCTVPLLELENEHWMEIFRDESAMAQAGSNCDAVPFARRLKILSYLMISC